MIIRGVIIVLSVVDFVFDIYDSVKAFGSKLSKMASENKGVVPKSDPSYSV